MTLQNLLGVSLDAVVPDRAQVARMLAAAERNLADAHIAGLSAETRFDVCYKAIMQLAMLALYANGYRTLTSRPGHHQTAIQSLTLTVGIAPEQVRGARRVAQAAQPRGLFRRPRSGVDGCRMPE